MTNNDDWDRFVAMMEKAGWTLQLRGGPYNEMFFYFKGTRYFPSFGTYENGIGKVSNIGDWRQWYDRRETPPPF